MSKRGIMFLICTIIAFSIFGSWVGERIYKSYQFNIAIGGHIDRAQVANTIPIATEEMKTIVSNIESQNLTSGYTSVLFRTPTEDVGFWYTNLKASLNDLTRLNPQASQLEASNVLMKLRETLRHTPEGISVYPNNTMYFIWGWLGVILLIIWSVLGYIIILDY